MPVERILVVDDEDPIREIVCSLLAAANYKTRQASSGLKALAILDTGEEFALLLSGLMMADLDGIGLLERTKEGYPDMPVVMVTAVHDISVALAAIRNGAYDYLLKPFEREQLLATVRRALENRRLKMENRAYQTNLESLVAQRTQQLRTAFVDLERSYDITLEALGDALDLKDSETEGHSKRVTAYTIALARAMGISPVDIKIIARGAFLHDIGKMAIPDEILRKPGKLTPEEEQIMRDHCTRGYHILRKIPFLSEAAAIVYTHQEHFDGNGYPSRLRGNEIPIGARIFAVADAMDAITSDRPYRKARSFDEARQEVLRCSGTQFDPNVVEVFLKIPNELWHELRAEINGENRHFSTFDFSGASATSAE